MKKGDSVLLGLRPTGFNLAGYWEFPGGKMEPGETPQESLKRELQEELGIEATIGQIKLTATHFYGATGILLLFFDVPYWKGEPKTVHHSGLKWVKIKDIPNEKLPEANHLVLDQILEALDPGGRIRAGSEDSEKKQEFIDKNSKSNS